MSNLNFRLYCSFLIFAFASVSYSPYVSASGGGLYVILEKDVTNQSPPGVTPILVAASSKNEALSAFRETYIKRWGDGYRNITEVVAECPGEKWGAVWALETGENKYGWSCGHSTAEQAIRAAYASFNKKGIVRETWHEIAVSTGRGGPMRSVSASDMPRSKYTHAHSWGYVSTSSHQRSKIRTVDDVIENMYKLDSGGSFPYFWTESKWPCIATSDFDKPMTKCIDMNYGK